MRKRIFKIFIRIIIVALLIVLLMYESSVDISYLYANF